MDVSEAAESGALTRGGADSSLEANNVYALQPRMYLEGEGGDLLVPDFDVVPF